jgi:hypothetical protein
MAITTESGSIITTESGGPIIVEGSGDVSTGAIMQIIEPIAITDVMIGSGAGTVVEVEHPEWAGGSTYNALQRVIVKGGLGTFTDLVAGTKSWQAMAVATNGNVYAAVHGGSIWMQTGGVGTFADLSTGNKDWYGMCASPNGDIYACVYGASIWKQTNGSGSFADLGADAGNKNWQAMCAAPNGDIYASVDGGSIWKRTGGSGAFADLSAGNKAWYGMCAAANGNIYASVFGGSIWMQTGGAGAFADLGALAGNKNWYGMAADPTNNDIYSAVNGGSIWKQTGGTGSFVDLVTGSKSWRALALPPGGKALGVYACVYSGSIWVSTTAVTHKIYESLVGSNLSYYPPIDINQTTPKWLEVSSTNKWKALDGKTTSQTEQVSPIVYTITPGVAFNSVALLNVAATSVTIAVDSPAYSQTVSTGATDIVKTDLAGGVASVLTITITNSAGLSKVGEIIVGNYFSLGTFKPAPTVGIISYSRKEQDAFGDWTIIPRSYSKKMSCAVHIATTSVDSVFNLLAGYRDTPLVWIGSTSYSSTILYGYYKDFSIVLSIPGVVICNLEIEGLT